jgi:hypothetical protein
VAEAVLNPAADREAEADVVLGALEEDRPAANVVKLFTAVSYDFSK